MASNSPPPPQPPTPFEIFTSIRSDSLLLTTPANNTFSPFPHLPSQFYMLRHHHARLLSAAHAFAWPHAITALRTILSLDALPALFHAHLLHTYDDANYPHPLKLRLALSQNGTHTLTSTPAPSIPHPTLFYPNSLPPLPCPSIPPTYTLHLSLHPTPPSLHTAHKTTRREPYERARALLPTPTQSSTPTPPAPTSTPVLPTPSSTPIPPTHPPLTPEILLQNPSGEITEGSITTPYFWRGGRWVTPEAACGGNRGTTRRWAVEEAGVVGEGVVRGEELKNGEGVWVSNGARGWGWGVLVLEGGGVGEMDGSESRD